MLGIPGVVAYMIENKQRAVSQEQLECASYDSPRLSACFLCVGFANISSSLNTPIFD